MADVTWSATWECAECGASGEWTGLNDGEWIESDHDCEEDE